jgi:hypothetical protein
VNSADVIDPATGSVPAASGSTNVEHNKLPAESGADDGGEFIDGDFRDTPHGSPSSHQQASSSSSHPSPSCDEVAALTDAADTRVDDYEQDGVDYPSYLTTRTIEILQDFEATGQCITAVVAKGTLFLPKKKPHFFVNLNSAKSPAIYAYGIGWIPPESSTLPVLYALGQYQAPSLNSLVTIIALGVSATQMHLKVWVLEKVCRTIDINVYAKADGFFFVFFSFFFFPPE